MVEDSLPEELWVQILSKLPAESLIRFRCVCKSWLQIINSRPFFMDHLTYQNNSNKYLMFHHHNTFYSLHVNESVFDTKLSLEIEFCRHPYSELVVYGTCNGLVCLSHDCMHMTNSIYLWNPIVRKIKILPKPMLIFDISADMVDFDDDNLCSSVYLCFGYDDDDYKVIMVGVVEDVCSVGIYSLSANCWSVVDDCENDGDLDPFTLHNLDSGDSRFVNGVAYFRTCDDADDQIVSFDVSSKVIREIELPVKPDEFESFGIDVYDGESLALSTLGVQTNGFGCLSIWFLRYNHDIDSDESVPSWERIFVIDSSQKMNFDPLIPVRFINDGKVLVKVGVKFLVCNLETAESGELKVEGMPESICFCLGESLALLGEDSVDVRAMSYQRK